MFVKQKETAEAIPIVVIWCLVLFHHEDLNGLLGTY